MTILDRSLRSLEWAEILEHYSEHCQSAPAKALALKLPLAESRAEAEALIELTEEALTALEKESFSHLSALDSLNSVLLRLEKQAVLDGKELYSISRLFDIVENSKNFFRSTKNATEFPKLQNILVDIEDFSSTKKTIVAAIDPDGRVKDNASQKLQTLRAEERKLHNEARDKLDSIVQKAFRDGLLQDRFFDVRDGRYLVPVKNELRNKMPGLIVESSASKATVFIEPQAIREYNDRIKQVELFIEEEIYAILSSLSEKLYPLSHDIKNAYESTVLFDLTIARGKFAFSFSRIKGASKPSFSETIYLDGLYHPLLSFVLEKEKIIRNSFFFEEGKHVLIISGPNTGGKTVLLKSIGLAALMAQSGFYLSCAGQAQIPFFTKILAQIGDAQSIELSLSSFSASIVMLKEILAQADENALVLVDEILHATDPDEAAALSQAILNHLDQQKTTAIITTHLNGLKMSEKNNFMSASMEFSTELMQPTYRLRLGIPGSSRALEIGENLGIPSIIIEKARKFLGQTHSTVNDLLNRLEAKERELENERENLLELREKTIKEKIDFQELSRELEEQKKSFRHTILQKIEILEKEAILKVEESINFYKSKLDEVNARHEASIESKKRVQEIRERFQTTKENLEIQSTAKKPHIQEETATAVFEQSGNVYIKHLKSQGILLSKPEEKNKAAEVLVGNMKIRVEWDKLSPLGKKQKNIASGKSSYASSTSYSTGDESDCAPELNLIGKNREDALRELNFYLDKAARSGKPSIRIVHGHGTGTLKRMVRDLLQNTSYDLKFRTGKKEEGGDGCTVVEFY